MMGRKQRNYRQTWSIVWERDHWHHIHFKAKRWANKRYRQQLKAELEGAKNTEQLLQPENGQQVCTNKGCAYTDTHQAQTEEIMQDVYPEEEDIAWLKKELSTIDFMKGAQALTTLLFGTGYARCTWLGEPGNVTGLEVATGGWSGCEEILAETHNTLWRALYWESTHRGGIERFLRTAGA